MTVIQYRATDPDAVFADDVVGAVWPYDGPYDPHLTQQAATAAAELVRYLNNATRHRSGDGAALEYAPHIGPVLRDLAAATARLDQLLAQLADFATEQSGDPTLYDDRRDRPGSSTAIELEDELRALRGPMAEVCRRFETAAALADHLGHDR